MYGIPFEDHQKGKTSSSPGEEDVGNVNNFISSVQCFYTNADSLQNKHHELLSRIAHASPMHQIIGITECKPKNSRYPIDRPLLAIDGYQMFDNFDRDGRGVCLYIHKNLPVNKLDLPEDLVFSETVWAKITLANRKTLVVGCVYRSPNSTAENDSELCKLFEHIATYNATHKLMLGDYNYPDINWDTLACRTTGSTEQFVETVTDTYMYQNVRQPTRVRHGQSANLLDLTFTNEEDMVTSIDIGPPLGKSDHVTLTFQFHCAAVTAESTTEHYIYNRGDYDKLRSNLAIDWDKLLEGCSVECMWDIIKSTLLQAIHANIPKRITSGNVKPKPMWMNGETRNKVKEKHRTWKSYQCTRTTEDYLLYTTARNQSRWATRNAVKDFEKKLTAGVKDNPKEFWRYARSKTQVKQQVAELLTADGTLTSNNSEKAEALNHQYAAVFTEEDTTSLPILPERQGVTNLEETAFSIHDVELKLRKLKIAKSPGPDGIHPRVFRGAATELSTPLRRLFMQTLQEGTIPSDWKHGQITPIFQEGSPAGPCQLSTNLPDSNCMQSHGIHYKRLHHGSPREKQSTVR